MLTYISRTEGLIAPAILMKPSFPPQINVVYDMFGVYANLICVSCKYDFASNVRRNVAKVIA